VTKTRISTLAELLADVIDVCSVLDGPDAAPTAGSLACAELHSAQEHAVDGHVWGEEPVRLAYAHGTISYAAALEHGRATVTLMNARSSPVPVVALARSLVEVVSDAWWMFDPEVSYVQRVQRLLAVRHRSAIQGERAAKADDAPAGRYGETQNEVEEYSRMLGLDAPGMERWGVFVCGSQRLPTATARVRQMFADVDVPSVYNLYSGFSHGELFALERAFERQAGIKPDQPMYWQPITDEEVLKGAVSVAAYALNQAGSRIATLYGLS
jgi:hypothetical protein